MKNILYINAGAGTGKTYRLTHDLPDYLLGKNNNPVIKPSEVIVTTFTEAAAAEIRERARKVLLENNQPALANELDTAAIGTIHAICLQFIQKYWYAIGMSPDSEILTEADKKMYRNQSISQLILSGKINNQLDAIAKYRDEFAPKHKVNVIPVENPEFWIEELVTLIEKLAYYEIHTPTDIANCIQASKDEVNAIFNVTNTQCNIASCLQSLKNIDANKDEVEKYMKKQAFSYADLIKLHEIAQERKNEISNIVTKYNKKKNNFDTIADKSEPTTNKYQKAEEEYKAIKAEYDSIKNFIQTASHLENDLRSLLRGSHYGTIVCDYIDALFHIAGQWMNDYELFKKAHGVIDYNDMELGMLALLNNNAIASEIANDYKLVMVDEFQDCNPVQIKIFDKLSEIVARNNALPQSSIWVGDPNQAIYSFRGSNTDLIEKVTSAFPTFGQPANSNGLLKYKLDTSYRSREPLVQLANKTFSKLFTHMEPLNSHNPENHNYIDAVHHWHFKEKGNEPKEFYLNLARRIKDMVESKAYQIVPKDSDTARPVEYKDIALLVEKHTDARAVAHEMMCAGVPVFVPEQDIWDRAEVQLLMSLMRLCELQDTGREHTQAYSHELASLLHLWENKSTVEVLQDRLDYCKNAKKDPDGKLQNDDWARTGSVLNDIMIAMKEVKAMSFSARLANLILLLSVNDRVALWGEAEVRQNNLVMLQRAANTFCQRCARLELMPSTALFTTYLKETKLEGSKSSSSNTVKVITYHGSKGLEWPVVMLLSLDSDKTNDKEVKRSFFGLKEQILQQNSTTNIPKYQVLAFPNVCGESKPEQVIDALKNLPNSRFEQVREENKKDATRLLYVGMTRAREYLFTTSYGKELKMNWFNSIGITGQNTDLWGVGIAVNIDEYNSIVYPKPSTPPRKHDPQTAKDEETRQKYQNEWDTYYEELEKHNQSEQDEANRHIIPLGKCQLRNIPVLAADTALPKYITPSKKEKVGNVHPGTPIDVENGKVSITLNVDKMGLKANIGTCIHNIFAAYNPQSPTDSSVKMAQTVIHQHGFDELIDAASVIASIAGLYHHLETLYPGGKAMHEVPFTHSKDEGTVVTGEMDLLWVKGNDVVLIDFKNVHVDDVSEVTDPTSDHYVGKYLSQLNHYTNALTAGGYSVLASYIYYPTLGKLIELPIT